MIPWKWTEKSYEKAEQLLRGALDMHTHCAPSIFARRADDRRTAEEAGAAGMEAVVIKSHEGDTAPRAQSLNKESDLPVVYGGVVLNHFVGGINPAAVEISIRLDGRFVWMPTVSAARHVAFHREKAFLGRSFRHGAGSGIRLVADDGGILPELFDIFSLVSEAGAVLCTGHVSPEEVLAAARKFLGGGYKGSFIYTHPDLSINKAPLTVQKEVAALGGYIEKCTIASHQEWGGVKIAEFVHSVREIGVERCFFSTDAGGPDRPSSPETLRAFLAACLDAGLSEAEIRTLVSDVPRRILFR
jgi:hypothetical protein